MLTAITYNCDPDSLSDVEQTAFIDAFENETAGIPKYRNTTVRVTFDAGLSGITSVTTDDDASDPDLYRDDFRLVAERAFRHCCVA